MLFDEHTMDQQHDFVEAILALASMYLFSVTSWGRTPSHNKAVGGVVNSQHLSFLAVDIVPDLREQWTDIANSAEAMRLVVIAETDHLHIQWPR